MRWSLEIAATFYNRGVITIDKNLSYEELLQSIIQSDKLDSQCMQLIVEMNEVTKILKRHPYELTYNKKKDRWYTRFDDNGKIIQKNRKTKRELEDCIVEFYRKEEPKKPDGISFTKAHDIWLETQKAYGRSNNSIRRYETDWFRFFEPSDFKNRNIETITAKDIEIFMIENIRKFNLKRRGSDGLYACISGVFYNAVMDRLISPDKNPCLYVDKKKFVKFYNTDEKTIEQRTVSPEEISLLICQINADIERRESYIYPYGIQLALLTGMRVGEIAGLRWAHVYDLYIKICESEKYDVVERVYIQSKTKNSKTRTIPITSQLREFLDKMRDLQSKYGCVEDYILSFADQKLRCKNLTAYMNHKSEQIKFKDHKSIHAIRRTFNSYLRLDGVSAVEAGNLIGNTPKVNDIHYTYDIQENDRKKAYMEKAEKRMISG